MSSNPLFKPLVEDDGIKDCHINVFQAAANLHKHIILLRPTNPKSVSLIGKHNYTPKPIDCKPKTASCHSLVGREIFCGGLVVDPTLLPNAFKDKNLENVMKIWKKFTRGSGGKTGGFKPIRRIDTAGFYAVDTYEKSSFYGCLMLSKINPPFKDFDLSLDRFQKFKKTCMSYIHGDYDLYGLIDCVEAEKACRDGRRACKNTTRKMLYGVKHYYSNKFEDIKFDLNRFIGIKMIQHGAQDNIGHSSGKLYVFIPDKGSFFLNGSSVLNGSYVLDESEKVVREVYRLVFKEEPVEGSF